jgi:hypothetical protein
MSKYKRQKAKKSLRLESSRDLDPRLLEKCRKGCKEDPKKGELCAHVMQALDLPTDDRGAMVRKKGALKEFKQHMADSEDVEGSLRDLSVKLESFGLKEWEIQVLLAHDVLNFSFQDIRVQGGYTSVSAVLAIYDKALSKTKAGYSALEEAFDA